MKHIKLFENFQNVQTLRKLIGDFDSVINSDRGLLKTTKGIIVNGYETKEELEVYLDDEVKVEDDIVYYNDEYNRECGCLGVKDGKILIYSVIPGDFRGFRWKGNTFFVYGHDGVEKVDLDELDSSGFTDRGDIQDWED